MHVAGDTMYDECHECHVAGPVGGDQWSNTARYCLVIALLILRGGWLLVIDVAEVNRERGSDNITTATTCLVSKLGKHNLHVRIKQPHGWLSTVTTSPWHGTYHRSQIEQANNGVGCTAHKVGNKKKREI